VLEYCLVRASALLPVCGHLADNALVVLPKTLWLSCRATSGRLVSTPAAGPEFRAVVELELKHALSRRAAGRVDVLGKRLLLLRAAPQWSGDDVFTVDLGDAERLGLTEVATLNTLVVPRKRRARNAYRRELRLQFSSERTAVLAVANWSARHAPG
jgi:hypothetical protein